MPTHISRPLGIAAGPDGNLWFTENWPEAHKIGRITPDGEITEFSYSTSANLDSIAAGPDGNMWFTDGMSSVARITPDGQIAEFDVPLGNSMRQTRGIVVGADENLWFRMVYPDAIGKITTEGQVTEYPLPHGAGHPIQLAAGPDGNVWFTVFEPDAIGRITPEGEITEFPLPGSESLPHGITAGPDGNLWFTERDVDEIGRITPDGEITEFPLPHSERGAEEIVAGPEESLWFTEVGAGRLGRITISGEVGEYLIPTDNSVPGGIAVGPDGNLWFTEWLADKIGRLTPGPPVPQSFHAPWITGNPREGETLFASSGSWTNSPTSYAYQWEECDEAGASCAPIEGADEASYALSADDVGHTIRVQVSASNGAGTGKPASSATTEPVLAPSDGTGAPTIERVWVTDVSPDDATLHAEIDPHLLDTGYEFHLGHPICPPPPPGGVTCMAIGNIDIPLPPGSIAAADHPVTVSVTVSDTGESLNPDTEYTYSVEAENAAGWVHSSNRTFRTPSESTVIVDPILPEPIIGYGEQEAAASVLSVGDDSVGATIASGCKRKGRRWLRNHSGARSSAKSRAAKLALRKKSCR